jgi:hypothetical protein
MAVLVPSPDGFQIQPADQSLLFIQIQKTDQPEKLIKEVFFEEFGEKALFFGKDQPIIE